MTNHANDAVQRDGITVADVLESPELQGKALVSASVSTTGSTVVGYVFGQGFVSGETFEHEVIPGLPDSHQEQSADALQHAVTQAFQSLLGPQGDLSAVDVCALGFDAMEHTLCARRGEEILSNLITWQDTRAQQHSDEFDEIFGHHPGLGLAGPKLLALSRDSETRRYFEEPEICFDILASLLPFWATGESMLGPSEMRSQGWPTLSRDALTVGADPAALLKIHPNLPERMPTFLPHYCFCPKGVSAEAAARWALPERIPVAAGLGDNQATYALFPPGTVVVSGGTSGTAFCEAEGEVPVGTFGSAYDKSFLMKVQQNLGQVGDRVVDLLYNAQRLGATPTASERAEGRNAIRRILDQELLTAQGRFGEATALAFLTGDRTPSVANPLTMIRDFGAMISDPIAYYELLMGTMTINLCDALAELESVGVVANELVLVGGLAKSTWWRKLVASLTGCRCKTLADPGMGSAQGGLVYLTWLYLHSKGYGFTPQEVSAYMVRYSNTVTEPDGDMLRRYQPLAERYRRALAEML